MKYLPRSKAITTVRNLTLPGCPMLDTTVAYTRGQTLVIESTIEFLETGRVVTGKTISRLDARTDELVVEHAPGEKGEAPYYARFRRGKRL